jgi:hypothetical protein
MDLSSGLSVGTRAGEGMQVVVMVAVVMMVMVPEKVEVIGLTGEAARKKPDADSHYQKSRGQLQ